ncbi:MAG: hypothetical protein IPM96_11420 [Ignavibacteria bacterium]|nr:hypothetical protein [Ignavibacteria bacterium]
MTTKELKHKIIDNIEEIDDENLLLIIKTILENYKQESVFISDKRKKILDKEKMQIKKKEYITDDEINEDEEKWLKE